MATQRKRERRKRALARFPKYNPNGKRTREQHLEEQRRLQELVAKDK